LQWLAICSSSSCKEEVCTRDRGGDVFKELDTGKRWDEVHVGLMSGAWDLRGVLG
jgi:hypothetical protein